MSLNINICNTALHTLLSSQPLELQEEFQTKQIATYSIEETQPSKITLYVTSLLEDQPLATYTFSWDTKEVKDLRENEGPLNQEKAKFLQAVITQSLEKQPQPIPSQIEKSEAQGDTPGLQNPGNACYLNATIQALRHAPLLKLVQNEKDEVFTRLNEMCAQLNNNQLIAADAVQDMRLLLRKQDYPISERGMEDAHEVLTYLFDQLNLPAIKGNYMYTYEALIKLDFLEEAKYTQCNEKIIGLPINKSEEAPTLNDLFNSTIIHDEYKPEELLKRDYYLPYKNELEQCSKTEKISYFRTLYIDGKEKPKCIPITLLRFDSNGAKLKNVIAPSDTLKVSIKDSEETALYTLSAIILHAGDSKDRGHYLTYVPQVKNNEFGWTEYNDEKVVHHTSEQAIGNCIDIASRDGYIYFYSLAN